MRVPLWCLALLALFAACSTYDNSASPTVNFAKTTAVSHK
jgi:hypothetical protein